jgi:alpha-galactosidase
MAKIAFIGAGSFGFTRGLVRDVLTFGRLTDATLALMDIDRERLGFITEAVKAIVRDGNYPAKVMSTTSRRRALEGADAVVVTILVGDTSVWRHDLEIPKRFGVDMTVGDTRGPAGIFRALRTIPVMLDIARDAERLCPHAIFLNYTNPMAMICKAVLSETKLAATGLCHSVQGTAKELAKMIGAPLEEIDYLCAGINHLAWYIRYEWNGRDAYPKIREALEKKKNYKRNAVRAEMLRSFGFFVTESSEHNSEYNWWFRKRPELIDKYLTHGDPHAYGSYAHLLRIYQRRARTWRGQIRRWIADHESFSLERGNEYAAGIIDAWLGGKPFGFNGNVLNKGLVTNLPEGSCVEVPVVASRRRITPKRVGALPPQCAAITGFNAMVEDLAVEGALTGDARKVHQAMCLDPLTAAVCSLEEVREMTRLLFRKHRKHLPQFKTVDF